MRSQLLCILAGLAISSALPAQDFGQDAAPEMRGKRSFVKRDGVDHTIFEHEATGAKIDFVTNSGICETTPGVNQYSGYLSVGSNENMWFWFFEARNNATTAPLATWFNGGPGCSSMIGLFQENGPCHFVNGDSTPSLNPYSFNEYANMLYVDQPIGTGFSYGTDPTTSTVTAAPYVWKLLQAFFAQFPQYESRDFGIFTESYGGHYGPEFASYFESQNAAIAKGTVTGQNLSLIALGINNGWYDSILQYKAYVDFSYNNTYKALITSSQHTSYLSTYTSSCLPLLQKCTSVTGSNSACENADNTCYNDIEGPLSEVADFDVYDIREPSNDPYPPETYVTYLQSQSVMTAIGAKSTYAECPDAPYEKFTSTGDDARSFLATLSTVVQSGITTLIWAGDADWICNWFGGLAVANAITYSGQSTFQNKAVSSYTVAGTAAGTFKTVGNLSWLRVFGAGHEVPYYQPAVALQVFKQTMSKQAISST
ncbi:carboxypeptidase-like protein S1 [Stipitochalara longipes BDJ]|nr:carboxypeptidase-like protein S1 [Stipitochalara longipes BDJ]